MGRKLDIVIIGEPKNRRKPNKTWKKKKKTVPITKTTRLILCEYGQIIDIEPFNNLIRVEKSSRQNIVLLDSRNVPRNLNIERATQLFSKDGLLELGRCRGKVSYLIENTKRKYYF